MAAEFVGAGVVAGRRVQLDQLRRVALVDVDDRESDGSRLSSELAARDQVSEAARGSGQPRTEPDPVSVRGLTVGIGQQPSRSGPDHSGAEGCAFAERDAPPTASPGADLQHGQHLGFGLS